jgi:DNA-3-methyladenine glycosylase
MGRPLPASFYDRDALEVARDLIGARLRHGAVTVRITEVEAYRWPDDTANHCHKGRTPRNAAMWGPPGRAYLYLCYGLHHMLNLVTGSEGQGAAVLVRAAEPLEGLELIRQRRGGRDGPALLNGPGKLAAALGLDMGFDHHPLTQPGGLVALPAQAPARLAFGPRVGIDYADPVHVAAPWRVADADSRWVSHRRSLHRSPP